MGQNNLKNEQKLKEYLQKQNKKNDTQLGNKANRNDLPKSQSNPNIQVRKTN